MYTKSPPIHQTAMALACNDLLLLDNPFQWDTSEERDPRRREGKAERKKKIMNYHLTRDSDAIWKHREPSQIIQQHIVFQDSGC